MNSKRILLAAAVCMIVFVVSGSAIACVGARPLAMGGAFIGLADDANTTYWNPAGLVQITGPTLTGMHTSTNRDTINYQDFVSFVTPITDKGAVGVSWINYNLAFVETVDEENWYWVSFGYKSDPFTSYGLNVKMINNSIPGLDTEIGLDLSVLRRIDNQWSVGLLVQDANEPKLTYNDEPIVRWSANWRPGVAYRPDNKSVAVLDIYDATDDTDSFSLRIGYEKWISDTLAVRGGYYGLGTSDSDALTFGVGWILPYGTGYKPSLDIAAMVGDIDVVLASLTVRF